MKKKIVLLIILVAFAVTGSVAGFLYFNKNAKDDDQGTRAFRKMQFHSSGNSVTATGVTNMGMVSETFDVTGLETELQIEEVYIASGDTLSEGEKVLKITDESLCCAREELENKVLKAELAYRAGTIDYERSKIVAEYERDSKKLSGSQAEAVYNDSIKDAYQDVDSAQSKLDQTNEQIKEYAEYVDTDNYKEYFRVNEYQKIYDENLKLLMENMEKWGIDWSQVTGQGGGSGISPGAYHGTMDANDEYSQWVSVLKSLYSVLEQNAKDLEKANEEYENALATASLDKKLLELSLPELQEKLSNAKASYEKSVLQDRLTMEKSILNAERADREYETDLEKAESDYKDLKSALEDAKNNLEMFEQQIGDGYFYAASEGNVLRVSARAGNILRSAGTVFVYSDPSAMTVTVSVDQSDIAEITLGESVVISSQSGSSMNGIVKSIDPVASSEGRNNVTYSVTVMLDGVGNLGRNESVMVTFGTSVEQNSESEEYGKPDGIPDFGNGEKPEGMPDGWNGEKPEGMPDGWNGEKPEGMPDGWNGEKPEGMPDGWNGEKPEGMPDFGNGEKPEWRSGARPGRGSEKQRKDAEE